MKAIDFINKKKIENPELSNTMDSGAWEEVVKLLEDYASIQASKVSNVSYDKIDDFLRKLDDYATDVDPYAFGLPSRGKYKEKMREIVRDFLSEL